MEDKTSGATLLNGSIASDKIDQNVVNKIEVSGQAGIVYMWLTGSAPNGYLLCDGSAVSRSVYAGLFAVIGVLYGAGDGSTTFNLPNLKGKVPVGLDNGQAEFISLGTTGGAKTHTLTSGEMPIHNHTDTTNSPDIYFTQDTSGYLGAPINIIQYPTNPRPSNYYKIATNNAGGGLAHNNLQPYFTINFIIKY